MNARYGRRPQEEQITLGIPGGSYRKSWVYEDLDKEARAEIRAALEEIDGSGVLRNINGFKNLESVAQRYPAIRQWVIDLVCEYLRQPLPGNDAEQLRARVEAQRILADHFRNGLVHGARQNWPGLHIDLRGATLINLDLSDCTIGEATFEGAHFIGRANFGNGTNFAAPVRFTAAVFDGDATFTHAMFKSAAQFDNVKFVGAAAFNMTFFDCLRAKPRLMKRRRFSRSMSRQEAREGLKDLLNQGGNADGFIKLPEHPQGGVDDEKLTGMGFTYFSQSGRTYVSETRFDNACFYGVANFDAVTFERPDLPNFEGIRVADNAAGHIWPPELWFAQ